MEKVLHPYDKELMRLAMLKHEQTFKQQVYELHRLYGIQKMLMDKNGLTHHQQQINQKSFIFTAHQIHHDQMNGPKQITESNKKLMLDEDGIELTLGLGPTSSHEPMRPIPDLSESGRTLSSSSTGSTGFPQGSEPKPGCSNGQQINPPWLLHALSMKLS